MLLHIREVLVCNNTTQLKSFYLGIVVILVCYQFKDVSADTELRRVYELNRDYLPERFKQLGIHAHVDFFAGDQSRSLYVPSNVKSEICRNQSRLYSDGIRDYNVWAMRMIDASGRIPSGLLNGHYMDLGNYEECMDTAKEAPYDTSYCVVVLRNLTKVPKSPTDWELDERENTAGGVKFLRPFIRLGVCLPASCNVNDLTQHYSKVTSKYNMSVKFDKHSCTLSSEQNIKLEKLDWFAIIIFVLVGTLCLAATTIDVLKIYFNFQKRGALIELLKCFSFYENGKSLLKTTSPERPLAAVHGIRVLSTFWVVCGHHILMAGLYPVVNNNRASSFFRSLTSDLFIYSELSVDNFLLMSGLLLVYTKLKIRKPSNENFNVSSFYVQRLVRITPPYFMQLLIAMTLYRFLNDGPLWKHHIYSIKDICEQSWWSHVLFLNNYIMPHQQCVPSAWYLAADMQLFVISPLLLIPILKGKKTVPLVIVPLLLVLSILLSTAITYFNSYSSTFLNDRLALREDLWAVDYVPTHARISPWLLGILVGYFLCTENLKLSKRQAICGWILSILPFACIFAMSRYMHSEGVQYNLTLSSIHNGLNNTAFTLLTAWIIVACETGYAGPIKSFLTWRAFQPFSQLSFTIYLVGPGLQYGMLSLRQSSHFFSIIQTCKDFGGELFLILMMAPFYHLLFEAPFNKLYRLITSDNKKALQTLQMVRGENKSTAVTDAEQQIQSEERTNSTIVLTESK